MIKEHYYDKLLHIKTGGQQGFPDNFHYHRYEPTPYSVLERLFEWYDVKNGDCLVDFGCGKGRLNFYVHYRFHVSVVGVEMNETSYQSAEENLRTYTLTHGPVQGQIQFHRCLAEDYRIQPTNNRFYFFNPFSVEIFMTVIGNILRSFDKDPRDLEVLLYYPSEDYIFFLDNQTPFELRAELTFEDIYKDNPLERLLVYHLGV